MDSKIQIQARRQGKSWRTAILAAAELLNARDDVIYYLKADQPELVEKLINKLTQK